MMYITDTELEESGEEMDAEAADRRRIEVLSALASAQLVKRDAAVEARAASGVERRWREDADLFNGEDSATRNSMVDYATGQAAAGKARKGAGSTRSTVVVNIVRSKTETAAGRFCEIMMPVDGENWELQPTPSPEMDAGLKDDRPAMQAGAPILDGKGNQASLSAVMADKLAKARQKMAGMQREISDQHAECQYNAEERKMIWDSAKLGTGVLKGPNVIKRFSHRFVPQKDYQEDGTEFSVQVFKMVEEQKPASRAVSPWNCYPDPGCGDDVRKCRYFWERDIVSPRDVQKLIGGQGYFDDQLREVLAEKPKRVKVSVKNDMSRVQVEEIEKGGYYDVWEGYVDVSGEDLELLDVEGLELEEDLSGKTISVCMVFINERPVKISLNLLETGEIPYDFFQWSESGDSPWGFGVPRLMMFQQRIITAAWRAMMDNAGDTAGAIRMIRRRDVEPADGGSDWSLTRNKLFLYTGSDDQADMRKMLAQFQLDSRQQELQAIIELALRFVDMETAMPTLFQGEGKTAPETLGATNIMVDANNIALRHRVKRFDDQITVPHLTRYYHYNMLYHPDESIKGDYQVNPRGVRVLLEKDQQAQAIIALWPLLADPEVAGEVDKKKAARQLFGAHRLDILKDDQQKAADQSQEQAQQQQPQPGDNALQAAQVRSEAQLQVAQLNQQSDMAELELNAKESEKQRQHEREMKEAELQIEMMKMANAKNISLESIKASLASDTMKIGAQLDLSRIHGKGPQVAIPPSEPAGKAPEGEAYQR